jgi:hypothetical protein
LTGADITNGRIARDLDVVGALMILLQRRRAERNLAGVRALIAFSGYRGGQLIALGRHRGQDRAASASRTTARSSRPSLLSLIVPTAGAN